MRFKQIVLILISLVFALLLIYKGASTYMQSRPAFTMPPVFVSTSNVQVITLPKYLPSIGSLKAVHAVNISSEVGGIIDAVYFDSGTEVNTGDVILNLYDKVEQAELKRYEASLKLAAANLGRSSSLASQNVESKANLDQKQTSYLEAEALLNQSKAIIERKRLKAPFKGKLGIFQVDLGQYIQPGTTIVSLTDLSQLRVNFSRPERDYPIIKVGQKVTIKVEAYPNKEFIGRITSIDSQISHETRMLDIQATLDNKNLLLAPGMYAEVGIQLSSDTKSIVIPETALDYSLYGTTVYILKKTDKKFNELPVFIVNRQDVEIGKRYKGLVEIKKGLKEGEQLVSMGQLKLDSGSLVVINNRINLKEKEVYTY